MDASNPIIVAKTHTVLERSFSEAMWNCGKLIGKITGRVSFNDPPSLKQMLFGVHTESGFSFLTSSVLRNESVFSVGLCGGCSKIPHEVLISC